MEFIFLITGIIIGALISCFKKKQEPIGTIRMDNTDLDSGPYLFLEIDGGKYSQLISNKTVSLRVDIPR